MSRKKRNGAIFGRRLKDHEICTGSNMTIVQDDDGWALLRLNTSDRRLEILTGIYDLLDLKAQIDEAVACRRHGLEMEATR